ncbi:MAG: sigma 54-interacting transcriptional regulator [Kiloniellaceae bacterium]
MFKLGDLPAQAVEEFIKVTTLLSTERDLNRLLSTILTAARSLTLSEAGRVYVLDATKRHLYLEVFQNSHVDAHPVNVPPVPLFVNDRRNHSNICAYCAFSGKLIKVDDAYKYSGFDFGDVYADDKIHRYRTRSLLVVPMRNHEEVTIGVLQLSNMRDAGTGEVTPFPDELEGLVIAFASQAAVALNNVQLIEKNRHLITVLDNTNRALESENRQLRDRIENEYRFSNILGTAKSMSRVFELMSKVLDTDATVLLGGETGTGKELIARAIHYNSRRKNKEFVAQNCAALPETLLESELFGYKAGAFTGARSDKKGLIELAHGGTLFLDEIGDMPIGLQAKLLRVLQESEVRPLGALESRKVDVRVIAATHMDLQEKIRAGEFREDLYYRLCVFPIHLPPLRERKEDLPTLLQHFLEQCCARYGKSIGGFSPAALDGLMRYDYAGNIRELRNIVERAVLMAESGTSILPEHLPPEVAGQSAASARREPGAPCAAGAAGLREAVGAFEAALIERKLDELDWNQTKAAVELGISRRTLIEKMHKYDIRRGRPDHLGSAAS